jgi:hypothetical protein
MVPNLLKDSRAQIIARMISLLESAATEGAHRDLRFDTSAAVA